MTARLLLLLLIVALAGCFQWSGEVLVHTHTMGTVRCNGVWMRNNYVTCYTSKGGVDIPWSQVKGYEAR